MQLKMYVYPLSAGMYKSATSVWRQMQLEFHFEPVGLGDKYMVNTDKVKFISQLHKGIKLQIKT